MAFTPPSIQNMYDSKQLSSPLTQIIFLIIIIVLFSWFLVKPKLSESSVKHAELTTKKEQLAKIESEKRDLNRLIAEMQSSGEQVKLVDEAIPLTGRATKLNVLVESLAKSSGMEVASMTVDGLNELVSAGNKEVLDDPYKSQRSLMTTDMNVLLTGSIEQFRNFLQLLETSGRIVDVSELDVLGGDTITRFRVKLKAYAYEVK